MRDEILEVIALQGSYSPANTPEMQRRGRIIRHDLPARLREYEAAIRSTLGRAGDDLIVEGRDGTGRKSEVPWVRLASKSRSPSAQSGWYVVWLFHAKGDGVQLWIGHGSTTLEGNSYVARSEVEIDAQLAWARSLVGHIVSEPPFGAESGLGSSGPLPLAYERSRLAGIWYRADAMPTSEVLARDLVTIVGALALLYDQIDLGRHPDAVSPDILAALKASDDIATGGRPSGQGFGLTPAERRAVELHAMSVVERILVEEGFDVRNVSAGQSYDFHATRNGEVLFVEVKGTTGPPNAVLLTAKEVELHGREHPNNALFVVHGINLHRRPDTKPVATGGSILERRPWRVEESRLRPISYRYEV